MKVSDKFTVAAAFGNVHGVYKPGNVKLTADDPARRQEYIQAKYGTGDSRSTSCSTAAPVRRRRRSPRRSATAS